MGRVQLIRKPRGGRWQFVAHGAAYSPEEAESMIALIGKHSGDSVRKLKLGKESGS